jgi:hypothetical protein
MLTSLQLLKDELKNAREIFRGTVEDIKPEHLHKNPGGVALPLGAAYAHLVFSEDAIVHGMLMGKPSLSHTVWKDKTGVEPPMPPMDDAWHNAHRFWAQNVKVSLPPFLKYAKAVYGDTDAYVNQLTDPDLEKMIDLGNWGKFTVAYILFSYIIGHTNNLAGEISALKGIQGARGYAF